jgi:hypothetical protein
MIYTIDPDYSILRPSHSRSDAKLIFFEGFTKNRLRDPNIDYTSKVPPIIEFVGDLEFLEGMDFLYTFQEYLIMSKRMLNILFSVNPFKHRVYPTRIYSYEIEELVRNSSSGGRINYQVEEPSLYTDKFVIMQLTEALDILDEDKTIIHGESARNISDSLYWHIDISCYTFTKLEEELPPVFATPKTLSYYYTEAAVLALHDNDVVGIDPFPVRQCP